MQKTLQPNSNHCFVCGLKNPFGLKLRFYNLEHGEVMASIILTEQYQGYPGVVHGGIVAAMLDEAAGRAHMGFSGGREIQDTRFLFTAHIDIRYRKNVPIGSPLKLIGQAGKNRGHTAQAKSFLYDKAGNLLAEADALLIDAPKHILTDVDLADLGWGIYPEEEDAK